MFCGECGTKLEEGMRFCPECGTPVKMPDFSQAAAKKPEELPAPEPEPESEVEPEAEPVVEAVPEPEAEPVAEAVPEPALEAEPVVEAVPEPVAEVVPEPVAESVPAPEVAAAPAEKEVRRGPQVYIPPQKPKPERKPARTGPQVYIPPQSRVVPRPAPMPEPVPAPVPMAEPVPMPEEAPQARMPQAPAVMPRAGKLIAEFDKGGGNMIRYFDDHIEFDGISVAYADIDYADEEASTTSARGLVFASHYHGHIEFVLKNGEKRKLKVSGTSVYGIGGSGGAKKRFHAIREPFYSVILTYLGERKAREIEQGATVVVGGVSVSPERMDVTKALGHKELTLSREEFGSAVLRTFDIMIRKKDGSKWTTIYRRIPNANILPYVLNRVYGNSTAPVTLEEEQPGMNEEI